MNASTSESKHQVVEHLQELQEAFVKADPQLLSALSNFTGHRLDDIDREDFAARYTRIIWDRFSKK